MLTTLLTGPLDITEEGLLSVTFPKALASKAAVLDFIDARNRFRRGSIGHDALLEAYSLAYAENVATNPVQPAELALTAEKLTLEFNSGRARMHNLIDAVDMVEESASRAYFALAIATHLKFTDVQKFLMELGYRLNS